MYKPFKIAELLPIYLIVFGACFMFAVFTSHSITVMSMNTPMEGRIHIVIDAGHGGEDGGAVSCTGVLESQLNLEVATRLNDLLHLLGYNTVMLRTEDISLHTEGNTIAAHKISDLKNRVDRINQAENALLVSIHQNFFSESVYCGAQVFHTDDPEGEMLATSAQAAFIRHLNPGSQRNIKKATGVYVMEHIQCPGILVECGFLSNPEEEAKLRQEAYQQKICVILASCISKYADARKGTA